MAVRSGCVVLSIRLCEMHPLPASEEDARVSLHGRMAQEAVQEWLQSSSLQSMIEDGTVLVVQVRGLGSLPEGVWGRRCTSSPGALPHSWPALLTASTVHQAVPVGVQGHCKPGAV